MGTVVEQPRARLRPYLWLIFSVAGFAGISYGVGDQILQRLASLEDAPTAPVLAALVLFAVCSFISFHATRGTPLPSFVVAIALGVAGHTLFAPIVANPVALASLVTASAAIILFSGGVEMPLKDFWRLFVKIALLALPGVLITGFAFSWVVGRIGGGFGVALAAPVVILLGAILASTDPAAIIPVLQDVRFKRRTAKDIVVAESALNDVAGSLLTSAFLKLSLVGLTVTTAYRALATPGTYRFLGEQVGFGVLFGIGGFLLLWLLTHVKRGHAARYGADQVYFLAAPIIAFVGAAVFGGSGFLAAFVAGLLFDVEEHMKEIEHFFYQVIDGVAKPVIFLLVGALVDVRALIAYAPLGIAAALVFMFILRPAMVFLMIGVFGFVRGGRGLSWRELLFISFVRETGAIPAVLLVTAVSRMTTPVHGLVEIGMWVILLTLIIAPPLTPWVARKLGVAS
ncbi:cation:proton antiporter [Phenylobacterium sp.]|uniref:cation:proton antiporter domain-containing protein n=1 Tax=Phenylobacterium sp. TaxID=1871053 RepID=UPI00356800C0